MNIESHASSRQHNILDGFCSSLLLVSTMVSTIIIFFLYFQMYDSGSWNIKGVNHILNLTAEGFDNLNYFSGPIFSVALNVENRNNSQPEPFTNAFNSTNASDGNGLRPDRNNSWSQLRSRSDFAILLTSHSSNHYIWHVTLGLLMKHWCNYKVFWAVDEVSLHNNYTNGWVRCMRRQVGWSVIVYPNNVTKSQRYSILLKSREMANTEHILFLLEDWLSTAPVSDLMVRKVVEAMDVYGLDYMRNSKDPKYPSISLGSPMPDPQGLNRGLFPYILWDISTSAGYFVNIQPAIWRRTGLLQLFNFTPDVNSFVGYEFVNVDRSKKHFQGRFAAIDTNPPKGAAWSIIYPHWHALSGGCWDFAFYERNGSPSRAGSTPQEILIAYGIDPNHGGYHGTKQWTTVDQSGGVITGECPPGHLPVGQKVWDDSRVAPSGWMQYAISVQSVAHGLRCAINVDRNTSTMKWTRNRNPSR